MTHTPVFNQVTLILPSVPLPFLAFISKFFSFLLPSPVFPCLPLHSFLSLYNNILSSLYGCWHLQINAHKHLLFFINICYLSFPFTFYSFIYIPSLPLPINTSICLHLLLLPIILRLIYSLSIFFYRFTRHKPAPPFASATPAFTFFRPCTMIWWNTGRWTLTYILKYKHRVGKSFAKCQVSVSATFSNNKLQLVWNWMRLWR